MGKCNGWWEKWRGSIYGTSFRGHTIVRVYCNLIAERPVSSSDRSHHTSLVAEHAACSVISNPL